MSTRSAIAIERPDGAAIPWIYCHWDGVPSYTGRILAEHYTTAEAVSVLLASGDLSILGPQLGQRLDFGHHQSERSNWCPMPTTVTVATPWPPVPHGIGAP